MFGVLYAAPDSSSEALIAVAREFSPRIEVCGAREVSLDLDGLTRLFGGAREIAQELRRTAADRGLRVRVAIANTRTTARLLAHYRAGITVVEPGSEAAVLAPLPLALLDELENPKSQPSTIARGALSGVEGQTQIPKSQHEPPTTNHQPLTTTHHPPPTGVLRQWGLRTLGEFAALAADDVAARLGQGGVYWQRVACGDDPRPLVPALPEERFEQALDLEWPIDGLEPLSFVLGRLIEPLSAHLERRDRGAAVLHVRLHLVTRHGAAREVHERSLQLPAPMRDARTLRTLALLDLESHPPSAAIDRVVVAVDPTPGRVLQYSLLTRPLPSPEQISTLLARLTALMGEGRCGSPAQVDSWQPGAFAMKPFAPRDDSRTHQPQRRGDTETKNDLCASVPLWFVEGNSAPHPALALRRFRLPVPARVRVEDGKPSRVTTDRRGLSGGRVETCAGPWRTSGAWWEDVANSSRRSLGGGGWDRDEWDVTLNDGATYRLFRERDGDHWFVDGIVD